MGTWDDGLYDNDSALDELWRLVKLDGDEPDPARLVARIGLLAWLNPVSVASDNSDLPARVAALGDGLARLPAATRAALQTLLDDPEAATKGRSRTKAATAAIGGYSDGPLIDALLRFPGAQPVIDELGERAAQLLDRRLRGDVDLYEIAGPMAGLGVLIDLQQAGLWAPAPERVLAWRGGFDDIDRRTKSERSFWVKYVRHVRRGFDLLGPAPSKPDRPDRPAKSTAAKKAPIRRPALREQPPTGPIERFSHPKFGLATLVARTRTGDAESLDLRFDDGVVRKILGKFVTKLDD